LLRHRTIDLWLSQVDAVVNRHGLVQVVTHPDRGYLGDPPKRARYVELLDALRERRDVWHALPHEVATWWRRRDAAEPASVEAGVGVGVGRASYSDSAVEFAPPH
jgi:hypothetical protein